MTNWKFHIPGIAKFHRLELVMPAIHIYFMRSEVWQTSDVIRNQYLDSSSLPNY